MTFHTPNFWFNKRGFLAKLLFPLSLIYHLLYIFYNFFKTPVKSSAKVICVGNATVGGSGKTPIVMYIANILKEKGKNVAILSRGYKGNYQKPMKVDLNIHDAKIVGDEALILAKNHHVYVAKNKLDGIKLAEEDQVEIIIMDDGMQNLSIIKDINILVIDGYRGFGNGLLLPAGPLRQSINDAIKRADCIIIADCQEENKEYFRNLTKNKTVMYSTTVPEVENIKLKKVVAFTGIGNPDKFYKMLYDLKFQIIAKRSFPDHHFYSNKDLDILLDMGEHLVTTEKDYVKINKKYHKKIEYIPIKIYSPQIEELNKLLSTL